MAAVALRMPSHYVPVEAEEMEYVEGGFYISNDVCKAIVLACCLNPIGATLIGIGLSKLAGLITSAASALGVKMGLLGGPLVAFVSGIIGAVIGGAAAWTLARACIQGMGIGVDPCYIKGTSIIYWFDINVR